MEVTAQQNWGCRLLIGPEATVRPCDCEGFCKDGGQRTATPPKEWEDPFLDSLEPLLGRFRDTQERRSSLFMQRCLRLGPDLETFEALLRHERVPKTRMDPIWEKELRRR